VAAVVGNFRTSARRRRLSAACSPFLVSKGIGSEIAKDSINSACHSSSGQKGQEERKNQQHMTKSKERSPQRRLRSVFCCFLS